MQNTKEEGQLQAQRLLKRLVSVLTSIEQSGHLDQDWPGIFKLKKYCKEQRMALETFFFLLEKMLLCLTSGFVESEGKRQ